MVGIKILKVVHTWKWKNGNQIEIIPVHNKELGKGLVSKILKRTGIKWLSRDRKTEYLKYSMMSKIT